MSVAYQGVPGAFGHEACLTFLPHESPAAKASFGAVLQAVLDGDDPLGMLPLVNAIAGPVPEVQALLADDPVAILSQHVLPIRMHLLGLPGARLDDIRIVASHPMAIKQCTRAIAEYGWTVEEAANTAIAAQQLEDPTRGVFASAAAAQVYGLEILRHDVHDRPDNSTTFGVLARRS